MERIFISYKRVDKDKVLVIKEKIEAALKEKCWMDIDGIESDSQFKCVIINAINKCEVFLFMYSHAHQSITSYDNDWTMRELHFAASKGKRIVFINIDKSKLTDLFEFDFGNKQQIDGTNEEEIGKLIKDLKKWLTPQPLSSKARSIVFANGKMMLEDRNHKLWTSISEKIKSNVFLDYSKLSKYPLGNRIEEAIDKNLTFMVLFNGGAMKSMLKKLNPLHVFRKNQNRIKMIGVGNGGCETINLMLHRKNDIQRLSFAQCDANSKSFSDSSDVGKIAISLNKQNVDQSSSSIGDLPYNEIENIKDILDDGTSISLICAGMGGKIGSNIAPIIAQVSKDLGIFTVGIVTIPFKFEGPKKEDKAVQGIAEMAENVDILFVLDNEHLRQINSNLTLIDAFRKVDDMVCDSIEKIARFVK